MLLRPGTCLAQVRHEATVNRDHVRRLRFARHASEPFNCGEGSAKRFFYYTGKAALEKFDTHLTNLLHRHYRHAGIRRLYLQHLVEIFIRLSKTERTTELGCSFTVEIARRYQLDFIWMCGCEPCQRGGMACP
jgi:hypothetical protein